MDFLTKNWDTVIIGGGQSGLAIGYFLKKMNRQFIILDENEKIGHSWTIRWDSLLLFTHAQSDGLPGMPFPAPKGFYPNKDQMAEYLQSYAIKFSLPVQSGVRVNHLVYRNNNYEIDTSSGKIFASKVVIATGTNPYPKVPAISSDLNPEIFQIHSSSYKNPEMLPAGDVLVVGAATSGIEIALEVSKTHKTYISGTPSFHIPDGVMKYGGRFFWWVMSNIITIKTPIGKRAKKKIFNGGSPLIRVSADDLDIAGIKRFPRLTGVKDGFPQFADGSVLQVSAIVWATGYRPDFSWIEPNIADSSGWPVTYRGVSSVCKGLYFVGMPFQYALTSGLVGGVGRDAKYISKRIYQVRSVNA
jgi:putative flavoprotein involved in K+ transport